MPTRLSPIVLGTVAIIWIQTQASATLRVWDGGGTDNFWTTSANWMGDVAPSPGDDLWFPSAAARLSPINDFPSGTLFHSLIFSGDNYTLDGNVINLDGGITATNGISNMINNSLVLNSPQTWTVSVGDDNLYVLGTIDTAGNDLTFDVTSPSRVQITATVSGAGGLITVGTGGVLLYGNNTFSGPVLVNAGAISAYHGNALGANSAGTTVATGAELTLNNSITVGEPLSLSGSLRVTSGSKTWNGAISLDSTNVDITVDLGGTLTINSIISGTNGFSKKSNGNLILNGNNSYSGTTLIEAGTLLVNGNQPVSSILNLSILGGNGYVGSVTVAGANEKIINPGQILGTGILTCSNVTLSSSSSYQPALNSPLAGGGYDQLNVRGVLTLNNCRLNLTTGFNPVPGTTFVLINNDSDDPVVGTFAGLPNGTLFNAGGGIFFKISYTGGDGNDVVLTRAFSPTRFDLISMNNGQVQLRATGALSGFTYKLEAATALNPPPGQWLNIGSAVANSNGVLLFTDPNAASFPTRFYRVASP